MVVDKNIPDRYKVLLSGGGTGGSVTPLLALVEGFAAAGKGYQYRWLGTRSGPERAMVEAVGIAFESMPSGKWRRYFSWRNFLDPFLVAAGFFKSLRVIGTWRPDLVLVAGGFVGVPLVWAAALCRIPIVIHQMDRRPGLANRLMSPFARLITVALESSLKDYGRKAVWTGNPVRAAIRAAADDRALLAEFEIQEARPLVVAFGGGTGASALNELVSAVASEICRRADILLVSGNDKVPTNTMTVKGFHIRPFLDASAMAAVLRRADLVVTRAGLNALTELAYLKKPAIVIPLPDSHQEDNAELVYLARAGSVLDQSELDAERFLAAVETALADEEWRREAGERLHRLMRPDANERFAQAIEEVLSAKDRGRVASF